MVAKSVRDAIELQQLIMQDMRNPKTTPVARAALARAWSCLQTSIREMRGIPLPGHLQPGALPDKRARRPRLIDLAPNAGRFAEAIESQSAAPVPSPTKEKAQTPESQGEPAQGQASKESLSPGEP